MRFGLRGDAILSSDDINEQERDYLHHHGDQPDRAGWRPIVPTDVRRFTGVCCRYTLQEMFMLTQSAAPAQRTLSLTMLGHVIKKQSCLSSWPQLRADLTDMKVATLLRFSVDDHQVL